MKKDDLGIDIDHYIFGERKRIMSNIHERQLLVWSFVIIGAYLININSGIITGLNRGAYLIMNVSISAYLVMLCVFLIIKGYRDEKELARVEEWYLNRMFYEERKR